jgi:hypothetical protein
MLIEYGQGYNQSVEFPLLHVLILLACVQERKTCVPLTAYFSPLPLSPRGKLVMGYACFVSKKDYIVIQFH